MTIIIFFGGLLLGFLIGWVFMAILSMVSMNRQEKGLYEEALISKGVIPWRALGREEQF